VLDDDLAQVDEFATVVRPHCPQASRHP
jgi:hypothetical protein